MSFPSGNPEVYSDTPMVTTPWGCWLSLPAVVAVILPPDLYPFGYFGERWMLGVLDFEPDGGFGLCGAHICSSTIASSPHLSVVIRRASS